ncbi:MAG: hypothetical protein ABW252_10280 [Polyangiales bacterium]
MQRDLFLLTVSFLLAAGCAEDDAPYAAPPAPAPEAPARDASLDDGANDGLDAGLAAIRPDAGELPATARAVPDAGAGCRTLVSDALIEHACFHARGGPYRDLTASTEAIDVSRAHTAFRVTLAPGSAGGYTARLAYRARTTGAYALFASSGARLARADPAAPSPFSAHPTELCPELPQVAGHTLTAGLHEIIVTSDQPSAMVVFESLEEGGVEDAYRVVCDGAPTPPAASATSLDAGTDARVIAPSVAPSAPAGPQRGAQAEARGGSAASPMEVAEPFAPHRPDHEDPGAPEPSPPVAQPTEVAQAPLDPAPTSRAPGSDARACRVDPVLEHACLHVQHGPFAEVDATGGAGTVPAISAPHTVYVLRLGAGAGRVAYRPVLPGQHVFYLEADLPLALHAPDGSLTPSHVEPVDDCPGLARAHVFNLTAGTRYEAEIGPGRATAQVLVESVDSLTFDGWDQRFEPCT